MMHLKLVVKVDTAATIFDNTAYTHTHTGNESRCLKRWNLFHLHGRKPRIKIPYPHYYLLLWSSGLLFVSLCAVGEGDYLCLCVSGSGGEGDDPVFVCVRIWWRR